MSSVRSVEVLEYCKLSSFTVSNVRPAGTFVIPDGPNVISGIELG